MEGTGAAGILPRWWHHWAGRNSRSALRRL